MIKVMVLALVMTSGCQGPTDTKPATSLQDFGAHLESLRSAGHIHTISAVIAKDQSIVWSGAFSEVAGTSDTTVFHLASLTKPLASTVILQLVDEGKVLLDDPVSKYGISFLGTTLVRHLLVIHPRACPELVMRTMATVSACSIQW